MLRRFLNTGLFLGALFCTLPACTKTIAAVDGKGYSASPDVQAFIDEMVDEHAFDRDQLNSVFSQAERRDDIIKLMATQQPVASDLRMLAIMMKINYDLERINDQAVNIAERDMELMALPLLKPLIDLPRMAKITQGMVKDALDAFVQRDEDLARDVCRRDDEVDRLMQLAREAGYRDGADPTAPG